MESFTVRKNAIPGDLLVLTKPLGTGVAIKIKQWWFNYPVKRERIELVIKEDELMQCLNFADMVIEGSNDPALELLSKYHHHHVHAVTQVSSGGIVGDANKLAKFQDSLVDFFIHNLPVIKKMDELCNPFSYEPDLEFHLEQGRSPEVSGGLLIAMPRRDAVEFCQKIHSITGLPAWIVGTVNYGTGTAELIDTPTILHVGVATFR